MIDWRGYRDAWAGREPDSDDESYLVAWREGLVDRQKAERFAPVNAAASEAARGRARSRAGQNSFIFRMRSEGRLPA